jgi:hypothetical protein
MCKKKYYLIYLNNRLSAIIKKKEDVRNFLIDRGEYGKFKIEIKKMKTDVEEYTIYARYYKKYDIVETNEENRYRELAIDEAKWERRSCEKELRKLKKEKTKYTRKKRNSKEYRGLKRRIKTLKNNLALVADIDKIIDDISDTIITQPSAVEEYLDKYDVLSMIARGEI